MGRGNSSGGGQSSLGYLFGSGEPPKPSTNGGERQQPPQKPTPTATPSPPADVSGTKPTPAVPPASNVNNYFRADGQNCGNFLTDRPTTKVHAAPGGNSSLDYLFGSGGK